MNNIREKVITIWKEVLETGFFNEGSGFFEQGGDSFSLTKMILALKREFNISIPMSVFFSSPTLDTLTELIRVEKDGGYSGCSADQVSYADALCDAESLPYFDFPRRQGAKVEHVFLTGATGFLGIYLLSEILTYSEATVYCLVRAKDPDAALSRIVSTAQSFKLYNDKFLTIVPLCGDVSLPHLGLAKGVFEQLSLDVDTVYHLAADVNHVYNYDKLYPVNVQGMIELLGLAAQQGKAKFFHYISTLSAVSDFDENSVGLETFPGLTPASHLSGYSLTKWVSEKLVTHAKDLGLAAKIYRLGNLTGDSVTGISDPFNNHSWLFTKGCIQMGAAPNWRQNFEMSPVDLVAKAIYKLSTIETDDDFPYHICNPLVLDMQSRFSLFSGFGFEVKIVPYDSWRDQYLNFINSENALYPLVSHYLENSTYPDCYACFKTARLLSGLGITFPSEYTDLLDRYMQHFKRIKFLKFESKMRPHVF